MTPAPAPRGATAVLHLASPPLAVGDVTRLRPFPSLLKKIKSEITFKMLFFFVLQLSIFIGCLIHSK